MNVAYTVWIHSFTNTHNAQHSLLFAVTGHDPKRDGPISQSRPIGCFVVVFLKEFFSQPLVKFCSRLDLSALTLKRFKG